MIPALVPFGWAASTYLYWVQGRRFDTLSAILDAPDPAHSPEAASLIYEKTWEHEFPFLSRVAFHLSLLRACAIPSIAQAICARSSEAASPAIASASDAAVDTDGALGTTTSVARRFEDTDLLVKEMTERPVTDARAQRALERAARISSMYKLSNDEYVYILAVMVVEPCRLVERWGYRHLANKEKAAHYEVWRAIGVQMGVKDIPLSFHTMEEYCSAFEARNRHTSTADADAATAALAAAAIDMLIATLPLKSLHSYILPLARRLVHTMLDPGLRQALRLKAPPVMLSWFADFMLRAHAGCVRYLLLPRQEPARRTDRTPEIAGPATATSAAIKGATTAEGRHMPVTRVYGDFYLSSGYSIDELGPPLLKSARMRRAVSMTAAGEAYKMSSPQRPQQQHQHQQQSPRMQRARSLGGTSAAASTAAAAAAGASDDSAVTTFPSSSTSTTTSPRPLLRRRATTISRPQSMYASTVAPPSPPSPSHRRLTASHHRHQNRHHHNHDTHHSDDDTPVRFRRFSLSLAEDGGYDTSTGKYSTTIHAPIPKRPAARLPLALENVFGLTNDGDGDDHVNAAEKEQWAAFYAKCAD
ncbi:hypothetical protein HDU86_001280 [Geranomyces michiganensis]|nr:hypothetical protein HDU86_001280 [Geranomyces michiganensis]